jgi:hypothetical protein
LKARGRFAFLTIVVGATVLFRRIRNMYHPLQNDFHTRTAFEAKAGQDFGAETEIHNLTVCMNVRYASASSLCTSRVQVFQSSFGCNGG